MVLSRISAEVCIQPCWWGLNASAVREVRFHGPHVLQAPQLFMRSEVHVRKTLNGGHFITFCEVVREQGGKSEVCILF